MKIAIITLFTILSTSTIFAMEEKENTECKNMVETTTHKVEKQTSEKKQRRPGPKTGAQK